MLYEIKHRFTGSILFSLECESMKVCVKAAVERGTNLGGAFLSGTNLGGAFLSGTNLGGADLSGADLSGAFLSGADLSGAFLSGADLGSGLLIDAGQDSRGYRFWAWQHEGVTVYRAGCREWRDYDDALAHYDDGYASDGCREECILRLSLLRAEALRRWASDGETA